MTDTNTRANNKTDTMAPIGGSKFPIATTTTGEFSASAAFDGTNYLVGIEEGTTTTSLQKAQIISQSGILVGSRISISNNGGAPHIGFNGTNYLLAWSTDAKSISGRLISKSGTAVTDPFAISATVGNLGSQGINILCRNTMCSVMWEDSNTKTVYGRDISSTGSFLTPEYTIETGTAAACDSSGNCIFVSDTGTDIRASIKGPTINKNTFVIATKAPIVAGCTDSNPSPIVFDGTNYLVIWNDHMGCTTGPTKDEDILAQRVDTSGNLIGTPFQVNSANAKIATLPALAFDGTNYLVTWTDGRNDANKDGVCDTGEGTCYDIYGQYISKSGTLVESEFVINNDAGNQSGFVTGFNAGKYLVIVNTGSGNICHNASTGQVSSDCDVFGQFISSSLQTRFEENDPAITYTGAWNNFTCASCSGGALKWANQAGARADFSFNGTGIRWIVTRGMMLGKAKVSLDGVVMGMVDLFNPTPQFQLVLQKTGLSPGNHSIGIEVSGEKNIDSVNTIIDIDAFEVVPSTGVSQFDGTYTGSWSKTCPSCGITAAAGTFTITVANGVLSNMIETVASGGDGSSIRFDTGTVSSSGAITGTGATPSQCSSSVSTFAGQITTTSSGGAEMTMTYSRPASDTCAAESGTMTATRI